MKKVISPQEAIELKRQARITRPDNSYFRQLDTVAADKPKQTANIIKQWIKSDKPLIQNDLYVKL